MSTQPWYTSMTSPALVINLNTDTAPDNITGLVAGNFAMVIRNTGNSSDTAGTGTFAIVNANPAIVTYTFSSGDVTTAGSYQLIVKATQAAGTLKVYDPVAFTLTAI